MLKSTMTLEGLSCEVKGCRTEDDWESFKCCLTDEEWASMEHCRQMDFIDPQELI